MRTSIAAVTALAGSLLLAPLMLGQAQAGSAPDLRHALSATHDSAVTLVRHGGGGGRGGGGFGGGHGGGYAMGGGHMGGGGRAWHGEREGREGHRFVEREGREGHRFVEREGRERFDRDDFRHRNFFVGDVFIGGYPYYYGDYGYYNDCYWLRRQAIITGSRYWWARYEGCLGYY
jgi:hypothetical protein